MAENISSIHAKNHLRPTAKTWLDLEMHIYIKITLVIILFYYLFRSDIDSIVALWITDSSNWGHGFLIPLFSLYFISQRKNELMNAAVHKPGHFRPANTIGLVLLLIGLAAYCFFMFQLRFGYPARVTVILILAAVILLVGGWPIFKHMWLPVGFLFFAIPVPQSILRDITIPMRILAANITAAILNIMNDMAAVAKGAVIEATYKGIPLDPPLDVADACSGIRLLMTFVALGVAMAYLHDRPAWQKMVLLLSTIPIAIFCNIIRVTITAFIYILIDPKYAQGIYHDLLGLAMLPVAFALYGLIAWFMANLFVEQEHNEKDIVVRRTKPF